MSDTVPSPGSTIFRRRLLSELPPETAELLARYRKVLGAAMALKPRHERALPGNIQSLSRALTDERGRALRPTYMSDAPTQAAYVHYFLPWNLFRLSRLLIGLGDDLGLHGESSVLDLGSGPLTMVQALWIARPDLRELPLRFTCVDRAGSALRTGLTLFSRLAGPSTPWQVRTVQSGLGGRRGESFDLVTAANVLNEALSGNRGKDEVRERLSTGLARRVAPGGRLLLVEPGTRLGGRLVSMMRETLLEEGLAPLAPCPHPLECPMPGIGAGPWCHFNFDVGGAPDWLRNLSTKAGLPKEGASLSFLFCGPGAQSENEPQVRAVSESFPLPPAGPGMFGRYGCSARGLVVLSGSGRQQAETHPGDLLASQWPEEPPRDEKSGGLILPLPRLEGRVADPKIEPRKAHDKSEAPTGGERKKTGHKDARGGGVGKLGKPGRSKPGRSKPGQGKASKSGGRKRRKSSPPSRRGDS